MFGAYLIITIITILVNVWATVADLMPARFVLSNMTEVGVPQSWLVPLATLKGAGAVGLLLGALGVWPLGIAAAVGLTLFFIGALAAHVRARAFHTIAYPSVFLSLAVASAVLAIAAH